MRFRTELGSNRTFREKGVRFSKAAPLINFRSPGRLPDFGVRCRRVSSGRDLSKCDMRDADAHVIFRELQGRQKMHFMTEQSVGAIEKFASPPKKGGRLENSCRLLVKAFYPLVKGFERAGPSRRQDWKKLFF